MEGGESMLDAADADALDVGAADLVGTEGDKLAGDDAPFDTPVEDYDLDEDESVPILDGGEEGPEAVFESLTEGGLPPLDADEEGAPDDVEAFFDEDLGHGAHDAWSSPWERFGAPLSLPLVRALVTFVPSGVLAAGRELVRVDLEGGLERLPSRGLRGGEVTRVVVTVDVVFVTTERGGLFASRDRGANFSEVTGWHAYVRPEEAAAGLDVVASKRGVWGRTAQGALLFSADGARWEKADVDGFARALGVDDDGNAVVLVRSLGASEVMRRKGDAWRRTELPSDLLAGMTGPATVVARGNAAAIAVEGEGVFRSVDARGWARVAGTEKVTAMAMLDSAGALILGLDGGEGDAQSSLVRIGADDKLQVVAAWDERTAGEGVRAIAVDEAHQVVWVGGGFGVAAFQPRIRGPQ
jgi:hypothetical protein